jgi:glucose-6-phosphate 1-dehydrogenase
MSLMQVKHPGLEMVAVQSELDLSYGQRYQGVTIPEAYERLILDTYDPCSSIFLVSDNSAFVYSRRQNCFELHTQL